MRLVQDKIKALESQNKTLAAQLRRLHQIVVSGGLRQSGQTSTALMVLLLSTALFLIPGMREGGATQENKADIQAMEAAVKMPPLPGQSRSLLQFDGGELGEYQENGMESEAGEQAGLLGGQEQKMTIKLERDGAEPPYSDHDYTYSYRGEGGGVKAESGSAWIDSDAPPMVSRTVCRTVQTALWGSYSPRGGGRQCAWQTITITSRGPTKARPSPPHHRTARHKEGIGC